MTRFDRRFFVLGSTALLVAPGVLRAQGSICSPFTVLAANARLAAAEAGAWALQTPIGLTQLRANIDAAEAALKAAQASATAANKRRALETLNVVATTGFFVAGLFASAATPVGAGILAGSILWGQGMVVVKAATFEDPVDGLSLAAGVGADRLGTVLTEFGASSYASSARVASYSGSMGRLLGSFGMIQSWAALASAEARYLDAAERSGEIYVWLADMRTALDELQDIAFAEKVRRDCMELLAEDAAVLQCIDPG
ncbi:MAG: hypothetical protein V2I76_06280 [Roseobacter sp.]|jgi:hypothetical protein|nr:hypothetical protein [Roseobacter sp.]